MSLVERDIKKNMYYSFVFLFLIISQLSHANAVLRGSMGKQNKLSHIITIELGSTWNPYSGAVIWNRFKQTNTFFMASKPYKWEINWIGAFDFRVQTHIHTFTTLSSGTRLRFTRRRVVVQHLVAHKSHSQKTKWKCAPKTHLCILFVHRIDIAI